MIFTELTPEEFRHFADSHPNKSFYQTPEIAKLRELSGQKAYYCGVKKGNQILAAALLIFRKTFLKYQTFFCPGGPLVDYEDTKLLNFFIQNLQKQLKNLHALNLHIEPYYELIERDRDGIVVPNGFNHQKAVKNLQNLGFKPLKTPSQPQYLFVMDINNRTKEQLLADFKRNTRNHIKKAEKMGVKIRELNREELRRLKSITASTADRRHFSDKPLEYYQNMYDLFSRKGQVKFVLAEAEIDGKTVDLSTAMFITYGDEVIYLFSGSNEKYMKDYNAQYLIQWHMIQFAAENHFQKYNFYGIQGLPDPNSPDYGIYNFKKGFGGRVVELLGGYNLTISPLFRACILLSKIKAHLPHWI